MNSTYLRAATAAVTLSLISVSAAAAPVLTDPGTAGAAHTVDFDDPAFANSEILTNQYASQGVTFTGAAMQFSPSFSADGTRAIDNFAAGNTGSVTSVYDFVFAGRTDFAGISIEFNPNSTATFQALLNGTVLETYVYTNTNCCSTPEFVGLGGFAFDTFRITNVTGTRFYADNLRFGSVSIGGAVPEPATWALFILGFGVVGGTMRARRRVSVSYA